MLALLLVLQATNGSPVYHGRAGQTAAAPPRIEATAKVDGVLDEPVWAQAIVLTGFSQYRPVDGRPAEDSTEVRVWYAPDAIWFGVRAYEAHGDELIRATLADRDNIDRDDQVQLLLDTFDDNRRALLFAVNPLGAQQDGVRSEGNAGSAGGVSAGFRFDGVVDLNPDFVFQSAGHLVAGGWEVEVRIPFKSLRYQSAESQRWGLQVVRQVQHSGYEDTWTPVVRANASFLVQSGKLEGLTDLRRGLVMDVTPEFTTRVDGAPQPAGYEYETDPELGGTARWGMTQNLTLAGTVNPDFSQVEADVGQVTVNERFALFFPEKRPFFLEGLEQFDTPSQLIYTRRIVNPLGGAKLTGKVGATGVGALFAADDDGQSLTSDVPFYGVLRVRSDLGTSSSVGGVATAKQDGSAYNRVLGADARLIWRTIWFSQAQVARSWTHDAAGDREGWLYNVTMYDRTGRSYGNHGELAFVSPDFDAQAGFVNRTNVINGRIFNRFSWYGEPGAFVEQVSTFIGVTPLWRYTDVLGPGAHSLSTVEGNVSNTWIVRMRGGWEASANVQASQQRFTAADYAAYQVDSAGTPIPFLLPHGLYGMPAGNVSMQSPNRAVAVFFQVTFGQTPIFDEAARGRGVDVLVNASWKPTQSLRVEGRWAHRRLQRTDGGGWFSTANIPRLKLEYQITKDIFVRYVGQYGAQERAALKDPITGGGLYVNGVLDTGLSDSEFRNDVLFSYKPTPGTVLFLGYGASLADQQPFEFQDMTRTSDGFFLKASYLFRM